MKHLLILTSLIISGSLWASPMDDMCEINKPFALPTDISIGLTLEDYTYIRDECERNNILKATYISIIDTHTLTSQFCRHDRNVNVIVTKDFNGADRVLLDCVLYSNLARNPQSWD